MTALDIGVIVITVFFLVRGIWIGFVRQIAFVLALSMGYLAAGANYSLFSRYIVKWVSDPQLRFVITYMILFLATYVIIMLLGAGLKKVMQVTFLGWFDRLMGGVFGLAKAAFIATLGFMALAGVFSNSNPIIQKSFSSKYLTQSAKFVTSFIKDKNLQQSLLPHQPAISAFLANPVPALKKLGGKTK
ncbi:MAG: CvpA family protein [Deltaproteobacteria bacterium]|nr:CvpA family protein [Deltaproteobacteria bacterium]